MKNLTPPDDGEIERAGLCCVSLDLGRPALVSQRRVMRGGTWASGTLRVASASTRKMLVLATVVLLFAIAHYLAAAIAWLLGVSELSVWAAYYVGSYLLERHLGTHRPDLRGNWFAAYVGRDLQRTAFSNPDALRRLDPKKRHIFLCYPHGVAPFHLIHGFAAHGGGGLAPELADKTLVVAHWCFKCIPFLRNLYGVYGVIGSDAASVKWALENGYSIALTPGGLAGKWSSLVDDRDADVKEPGRAPTVVVHRSRDRLGVFAYAARYDSVVVPIFGPDEDYTYRRFFRWTRFAPLVLITGSYVVFQHLSRLEWLVGRPIEARRDQSGDSVARAVYAELAALAQSSHRIDWVDVNDGKWRWWWQQEQEQPKNE
jgi:hypothetical protein